MGNKMSLHEIKDAIRNAFGPSVLKTGLFLTLFDRLEEKFEENQKLQALISVYEDALEKIASDFGTDYCDAKTMIAKEALGKEK